MSSSLTVATSSVPTISALSHIFRTFRERLLSGFSWNVLSAVALQGSVLLSSVIIARLLGLTSFGAYAVLVSTVMTVAAIAQGGSGLVASKFIAESLASDPHRVARVLRMCRIFTLASGACTGSLVFAAAGVVSADVLGRPELESLVRLVAVASFFQVTVSYQSGALQGFGAFRALSHGGVLAGLGHVAFTVVGAWFGQLNGALIGFVLASGFRAVVFGQLLRGVRRTHGVPADVEIKRGELSLIWRFALPAGLAGFVTMPCLWLVTVLVARQPDGLALVAILSVAHQVRLTVLVLPSLLNAVSFSVLSRLKGENETVGFRNVFWSNLWMNLVFSTAVVAVLVVLAEPVLQIYGPDFTSGRWVLVLLLVSVLPELLAASFYQLVQSAGRMWHSLFLIAMPRDFLYLGLAVFLVPSHEAIGAAAAYLAAYTLGLLATVLTAHRFAATTIRPHAGR